jgi:hypothetical protein
MLLSRSRGSGQAIGSASCAALGINQRVASEALGHSDPRVTARYCRRVDPKTVRAITLQLKPAGTDHGKK